MTLYTDERPHPIPGMTDNPEWAVALTRRAELYLEDRARRENPEREPSRMNVALAIMAVIGISLALAAAWL
jgi:hypothetical protein